MKDPILDTLMAMHSHTDSLDGGIAEAKLLPPTAKKPSRPPEKSHSSFVVLRY